MHSDFSFKYTECVNQQQRQQVHPPFLHFLASLDVFLEHNGVRCRRSAVVLQRAAVQLRSMSLVHVAARDRFETFERKFAALDDPPSKRRTSNGGGSSSSSNAAGPNVQLDSGRDKKRKSSGGGGGSGEGGQRGGKSAAKKARSTPASKAASPHLASAPVGC